MTPFSGGTGSIYDPFLIANRSDFESMVDEEYYSKGYCFKQIADVDFKSIFWGPYTTKDIFTGFFDGNNKIISNLTTDFGLFGNVSNSGIIRVNIQNGAATNINDNSLFGFVAAQCHGGSYVAGCNVSGTATKTYSGAGAGTSGVGGICGGVEESRLEYNYANLISNSVLVGGIIGSAQNSEISACHSSGTLTSRCRAGGIIGLAVNAYIHDCYSDCDIRGGQSYSFIGGKGGIVGQTSLIGNHLNYGASAIYRCYATGNITETGGSYDESCAGILGNIKRGADTEYFNSLQAVRLCVALNETVYSTDKAGGVISTYSAIPETSIPNPAVTGIYQRDDMQISGALGVNGIDISSSTYHNQSFWEDTLSFDFGDIWYWNSEAQLPKIRPFSYTYPSPPYVPIIHDIYEGIYPTTKPGTFTGVYGILPNQE